MWTAKNQPMNLRILLFTLFAARLVIAADYEPAPLDHVVEGVYTLFGRETKPDRPRGGYFQTTILELKDGRFRFWFSSDAKSSVEPKYPQTGTYTAKGGSVTIRLNWGTPFTVNGVPARDYYKTEEYQCMTYQGRTILWPVTLLGPPKEGRPPHNVLFPTSRQPEEIWKQEGN